MALKIPDAPNIIGTQPVLRQPDSINPNFERPDFKVDVSDTTKAVKSVGNAYADYVDYTTNIWMGAACNQFTHDLLSEEQKLKDTHKGLAANDLYAQLEKKATVLLDDITGDPKDDGRVRIANPELRKRFRDWANKQMPAYQSRMMNYSASELEAANKAEIKRGIEDNNTFVLGSSYETAGKELEAAWTNYQRAAQLSAPGMPKEYQDAEAARMMDEAIYAKMKMLNQSNVLEALTWYNNVPEIQQGMSSASKAKFYADVKENYKDQAASRVAELMASGQSLDESGHLARSTLDAAFPGTSDEYKQGVVADIMKKAKEINDAHQQAMKEVQGIRYESAAKEGVATDNSNPDQVMRHATNLNSVDPRLAKQYIDRVQHSKYVANLRAKYDAVHAGNILDSVNLTPQEEADYRDEYLALTNPEVSEDEYIAQRVSERLANSSQNAGLADILEATDMTLDRSTFTLTADDVRNIRAVREIDDEYTAYVNQQKEWLDSPIYKEFFMKATSGEWNGEYDPRLDNMPEGLYQNLEQVVANKARVKEAKRYNPRLDSQIKEAVDKWGKKSWAFQGKLETQVAQDLDAIRQRTGAYPEDTSEVVRAAVYKVQSPTKVVFEKNLSESQKDWLAQKKINPYLNPGEAYEALEDEDLLTSSDRVRTWLADNSTKSVEKLVDKFIDTLPANKRTLAKDMKDSIIYTVERTGDWEQIYEYFDSIAKK